MTKIGTAEDTNTKEELAPLWPNGAKIPSIVLSGEFSSGKTLFGLLLDPEGETLVIDLEDSSEPYENQIPFTRKDLPAIMAEKYKGRAKPHQLWSFFLSLTDAIEPGKFRVCLIDPASELETGLVEYVRRNPGEFGLTQNQLDGAPSLLWGAVKNEWKRVLLYLASKFETTVITVHMRQVFEGGRPVRGKREPKGKETLSEVASLSLQLMRELDASGKKPNIPAAKVLKSRLTSSSMKDGELTVVPVLPDRLPEASGKSLREYLIKPAGASGRRKQGETLKPDTMSDEDRLLIAQEIEEDKARTAEAEVKRLSIEARLKGIDIVSTESIEDPKESKPEEGEIVSPGVETSSEDEGNEKKEEESKPSEIETSDPGDTGGDKNSPSSDPPSSSDSPEPDEGLATKEQLSRLVELKTVLEIPSESWTDILSKRDVSTARDLWEEQADQLIYKLAQVAEEKGKVGELEKWAREVLTGAPF